MFPCLTELWQSPQLTNLNPKILELLIATIRHFYSNEKLIEAKVAEFLKTEGADSKQTGASSKPSKSTNGGNRATGPSTNTADATGTSSTAGGGSDATGGSGAVGGSTGGSSQQATPSSDPTPSQHPGVDPVALQQLADMGFSQDSAAEALVACGNSFPMAMDWILNHQPARPSVVSGPALGHREAYKVDVVLVTGLFGINSCAFQFIFDRCCFFIVSQNLEVFFFFFFFFFFF